MHFNPQWFISPGYSHYLWFVDTDFHQFTSILQPSLPSVSTNLLTISYSSSCVLALTAISSANIKLLVILPPILNLQLQPMLSSLNILLNLNYRFVFTCQFDLNILRIGKIMWVTCNIPAWLLSNLRTVGFFLIKAQFHSLTYV
jgi:hypothetical protein